MHKFETQIIRQGERMAPWNEKEKNKKRNYTDGERNRYIGTVHFQSVKGARLKGDHNTNQTFQTIIAKQQEFNY